MSVTTENQSVGQSSRSVLPTETRPWGAFFVLEECEGFKVKRLLVLPQGQLSLQSHRRRAEHWVVVNGEATVTLGEEKRLLIKGQSIDVPLGAVHRIENFGEEDVEIIEVQFGDYLGEDDITRYEDVYSRV